jgi:transposase
MANRQRDPKKEAFWRRMMARWRRSHLTVRDFCAEQSLSEPSFSAWRQTLARRDAVAPSALPAPVPPASDPPPLAGMPAFLPVHVVADSPQPAAVPTDVPLDLVLPSGLIIRVRPDFDAATLQRLLAILEALAC